MRSVIAAGLIGILGCHGSQQSNAQGGAAPPPESEAPVALNPDVPIAYPPASYEQKVEGDVALRLFVDSTGKLIPESTRVAEPSGYAALDSRSEEHTSELQSPCNLVCRLLLEKKKNHTFHLM